ncbi:hypothetical protein Taro_033469 [Colocasia esculenta]|uniref:Uncharacterized protein n=1 Tax=Colocasia esculenta TaxID=4460 RepID=A0A843W725_COLES|nr:hypothetical protein [Colocasia esculenta]
MAACTREDYGLESQSSSIECVPSSQHYPSSDSLLEWRSSEQVENGTPSTSPPYWDTDEDDNSGCWEKEIPEISERDLKEAQWRWGNSPPVRVDLPERQVQFIEASVGLPGLRKEVGEGFSSLLEGSNDMRISEELGKPWVPLDAPGLEIVGIEPPIVQAFPDESSISLAVRLEDIDFLQEEDEELQVCPPAEDMQLQSTPLPGTVG